MLTNLPFLSRNNQSSCSSHLVFFYWCLMLQENKMIFQWNWKMVLKYQGCDQEILTLVFKFLKLSNWTEPFWCWCTLQRRTVARGSFRVTAATNIPWFYYILMNVWRCWQKVGTQLWNLMKHVCVTEKQPCFDMRYYCVLLLIKQAFVSLNLFLIYFIAYEWLNPSLWTHCFRCSANKISIIDLT